MSSVINILNVTTDVLAVVLRQITQKMRAEGPSEILTATYLTMYMA
jgi:hypothetical protein